MKQICHNVVTGTYNLRNCTSSVFNKLLSVTEPNIGTMGQSRNLKQVGKCFRLSFKQHSANKVCSYLGQRKRAGLGVNFVGVVG